ncbi:Ig-like domain-containing protein [Cellulomonas citrea]|uniref:Ig-like domain-containing protein n=1 Tax=Cellulomonas citrea TaxID=1909423 RepID=UPI00135AA824|nr:Ig-like domain-containing protein [Cellulomonas citrea]
MRHTRSIARLAVATMLLAGLGVAGATSASAQDDGPLQQGHVYLFNNHKNLATATAADQVTGQSSFTGRAFTSVAVDGACPAGTAQTQVVVRLKSAAAEAFWDEVPMGASELYTVDANGHAYIDTPMDNFNLAMIQNFVGSATKVLPLALVCMDENAATLGYFSTDVSIAPLSAPAWSQVTPPGGLPAGNSPAATSTTLTATAQGANLLLTAAVSPAASAGTVTFAEGSTTLATVAASSGQATTTVTAPSAGNHTYRATFTPSDTASYSSSSVETTVSVTTAADGTITVTLVVPAAPLGAPGAVTLAVPASSSVALTGTRDDTNTRVTASAALPAITVTDTHRADLQTSWQVNVQASDFSNGSTTIGAKYLGLAPALPTTVALDGPATVVQAGAQVASNLDSGSSKGLSQAQPLGVVATKGQGTTTLGGQLNLAVPGSTAEGTYTSVITVTLIGG